MRRGTVNMTESPSLEVNRPNAPVHTAGSRGVSFHVAIDTKNFALYAGGIAAFMRPLVSAWLAHRQDVRFSLIGPPFDTAAFASYSNWSHVTVAWPARLPRPLRHPAYDNLLFPRALRRLAPDFLFSPYHDVRLPAPGDGPRAVMIVHDTCLDELKAVYPIRVRAYYLAMLRLNLRRAAHVITDSEASRASILGRYPLAAGKISVVYNSAEPAFAEGPPDGAAVAGVRAQYGAARILLYPSGSEHRKNVGRLLDALELLAARDGNIVLLATGHFDPGWARAFAARSPTLKERVRFLGRLDMGEIKAHYAAAHAVIYPTLCEGFGRPCLEAMLTGAPIACSDLAVLREVAGDYAHYFDPYEPRSIAAAILAAMASGRRRPRHDARFELGAVAGRFTALMDRLLAEVPLHA